MGESRPWTPGERTLVAISIVGLVAVGLFAWRLSDRDVDTSGECPPVEAALKKLEHAGRDPQHAATWVEDAVRGHFCANPEADEDSTRALLERVRTAVARTDRRAHFRFEFWNPAPPAETELPDPPSTRSGTPSARALSYVLAAQNVDAPWVVAFGKDRLLLGAATGSLTPAHRYELWLRSAGRWRMVPFGPACANPSVVWLDVDSSAIATTCADDPNDAVEVHDLLHPGAAAERVEHVGGPTATEENAIAFDRWYDPAHVEDSELPLRWEWRIARENGALVSRVTLLDEDRKRLYDLVAAPEKERQRVTENADLAAVLGRLSRASIGEEAADDESDDDVPRPQRTRFLWRCDDVCRGEGGCSIALEHADSGPRVLFEDLPPSCDPTDLVRTPDPSRVVAPHDGRVLAVSLPEPAAIVPLADDWLVNGNGLLQRIPGKGGRFAVLVTTAAEPDLSCDGSRRLVRGGPDASIAVAFVGNRLMAKPLAGGPDVVLVDSGEIPAGLAADATNAYVLSNSGLEKIALSGGAAVDLTAKLNLAVAVDVAADALWVLDQDDEFTKSEFVRIPLSGGAPERFPAADDGPQSLLAADAHALYWADGSGRLRRFDLATHADKVLFESGQTLTALALGDDDLFVAVDSGVDAQLVRIPKTGGKPVTFATGQPRVCALAVRGDTVAWEAAGTLATAPWKGPPITTVPGLPLANQGE